MPSPRPLDQIVADAPGLRVRHRVGDGSITVTGVTLDSRKVGPGTLFSCIRGGSVDGHSFAAGAVAAGASALLVDHELALRVAQVVVEDTRSAVGPLAASFWGHPSQRLRVVGVTGTDGKTTTTHVLASVLESAGLRTGIVGTLSGVHTTPEAPDLQERLAGFLDDGCVAVAMEVSSHALALHRVDATRFAVAVFTNLGRDHLDFHGTVERYFAAKAMLFGPGLAERATVNADDRHGRLLLDAAEIPTVTFGLADAEDLVVGPTSSTFRWRGLPVHLPLGGRFNVANALAAASAASLLGLPDADIARGLSSVPPVPGRFEPVDAGQDFAVVVDYAHTPDGLREVLTTARESARGGRVLVVFGAGGDRDAVKRPEMGAVAAVLADVTVVTSDNPRSEDPGTIIEAVTSGIPSERRAHVVVEPDRRAAIAVALEAAAPGDIVVIAGKGHETTQTIGDRVVPFDDRAVAHALLSASRADDSRTHP
jgi:UDP-N-acetylmuramoyl-L-alanyl-D-glutamate--2,6-diaminopimelate ligase